jgi:Rrf2 family protein
MALLASDPGRLRPARRVAETLCVSEAHLSKVMQRLSKQGFVESVRGPKGGFRLSGGAEDATLLDILEAIDGPFEPSGCLLGRIICGGRQCIMGDLLRKVNDTVREYLSGTSLGEAGATLEFATQEG